MSPGLRYSTQCQADVQRQRCRPRQASIRQLEVREELIVLQWQMS